MTSIKGILAIADSDFYKGKVNVFPAVFSELIRENIQLCADRVVVTPTGLGLFTSTALIDFSLLPLFFPSH